MWWTFKPFCTVKWPKQGVEVPLEVRSLFLANKFEEVRATKEDDEAILFLFIFCEPKTRKLTLAPRSTHDEADGNQFKVNWWRLQENWLHALLTTPKVYAKLKIYEHLSGGAPKMR